MSDCAPFLCSVITPGRDGNHWLISAVIGLMDPYPFRDKPRTITFRTVYQKELIECTLKLTALFYRGHETIRTEPGDAIRISACGSDPRSLVAEKIVPADAADIAAQFAEEGCYKIMGRSSAEHSSCSTQAGVLFKTAEKEASRLPLNPIAAENDLHKRLSEIRREIPESDFRQLTQLLRSARAKPLDMTRCYHYLNAAVNFLHRTLSITPEEVRAQLDRAVVGQEKAKCQLTAALMRRIMSVSDRGTRIMLEGTNLPAARALALAYAEIARLHTVEIVCPTVSALSLKGASNRYINSSPGLVSEFAQIGTSECAVLLNSYENTPFGCDEDGNPSMILNSIIENNYYDDCVGMKINLPNTDFIAIVSNFEKVTPVIAEMFRVIHVEPYTTAEQIAIAKKQMETLSVRFNRRLHITDETLEHIIRQYTSDGTDLEEQLAVLFACAESDTVTVRTADEILAPITETTHNYRLQLTRYHDDYTPEAREIIRRQISILNDEDKSERETAAKKLGLLMNLKKHHAPAPDIGSVIDKLDQSHYGMAKVKNALLRGLRSAATLGNTLHSICLIGSAGVGKTTIAESFAAACGRPFRRVPLNGLLNVSDTEIIRGSARDAGSIVKAAAAESDAPPVLLMDEVDKPLPFFENMLLDLIDSYQWTDNFVGHVDLSEVLFIFTANDESSISPYLRDRFDLVIYVDDYTESERRHIVRMIVDEENRKASVAVTITEETVALLAEMHADDGGVREMKRHIREIIRRLAADPVALSSGRICITEADAEEHVDAVSGRGSTIGF